MFCTVFKISLFEVVAVFLCKLYLTKINNENAISSKKKKETMKVLFNTNP